MTSIKTMDKIQLCRLNIFFSTYVIVHECHKGRSTTVLCYIKLGRNKKKKEREIGVQTTDFHDHWVPEFDRFSNPCVV